MQGYCIECKKMRDAIDVEEVTLANRMPVFKGKCADCGSGITKDATGHVREKTERMAQKGQVFRWSGKRESMGKKIDRTNRIARLKERKVINVSKKSVR